MLALIVIPLKSAPQLIQDGSPSTLTASKQSMTNQHFCPCCSHVLLRHIGSEGLYWRCSRCHEVMPIL